MSYFPLEETDDSFVFLLHPPPQHLCYFIRPPLLPFSQALPLLPPALIRTKSSNPSSPCCYCSLITPQGPPRDTDNKPEVLVFRSAMGTKLLLVISCLLLAECCLIPSRAEGRRVEEKAEAALPVTSMSPPEGNTTFIGGTTWCVALSGVPQVDLQSALDWACGLGMADCHPIREGGPCFKPDTLLSHASYAFNSYYQQNGNSDIACNFGGTATITKSNPSYGKCVYAASGLSSSAPRIAGEEPSLFWWNLMGPLLLVLFLRS